MATASNSPPAPIQSQNSPRTLSFGSHEVTSLPNGSLSVVDQQQSVNSSDSLMSKETSVRIAQASSVTEDNSAPGGSVENYGSVKKPVWKKPSNNAIADVGAVMGADSWPALSESARASPKASSTDSLKSLPHVSLPVSQVMSPHKEVAPNSPSNHAPSRQRSLKFGGGSSGLNATSANTSLSQAPTEVLASPGKSGVETVHRNDHHQRGTYRRSNSGPLLSHHNNNGGKRDQERGKQDWNNHNRSFGNKESHAPQQRGGSRPFMRGPPPPANAPFIAPQQPPHLGMRPYGTPMIYTELPSPIYYVSGPHQDPVRPMPMVQMAPMFFHMDPHLPVKIVNQIDYYFSNENLVRDTYLRQNMDSEGWVPVTLIAGFKKVAQLTDSIQLILDVIQASNHVEVQGDKLRRKNDWMKWIIPTSPQPLHKPSQDMLGEQLKSIALDEKAAT